PRRGLQRRCARHHPRNVFALEVFETHIAAERHVLRAAAWMRVDHFGDAKIRRKECVARRENCRAFHRVSQLAQIPRPAVLDDGALSSRRKLEISSSTSCGKKPKIMFCEIQHILGTLAQRQESQRDDVQPKEKVLAKAPLYDVAF